MKTLAVELQGLTKRYGTATVVDRLDLAVPQGAVFGFVGPNGAGKTTTLKMMLGLVKPTQGVARVLGHDMARNPAPALRCVGAMVETPAFFLTHTAAQNLRILAHSSGLWLSRAAALRALQNVGLQDCADVKVHTFSLGMKQRLGLAAVMLSNPRVLFWDEPTHGLDPAGMVEMRLHIQQLAQEGRTLFISSHLLGDVEKLCSHVAIVQKGVLRRCGTLGELLAHAAHKFLLVVTPLEQARQVLGKFPGLAPTVQGTGLQVTAPGGDIAQVVAALVAGGVRVHGVEAQRQSLEQLFLKVTE